MGNKSSVPTPTEAQFTTPHEPLDPPLSAAIFTGTAGVNFTIPRNAWTRGCVIEELGGLRVVPDETAKSFQGSRCSLYLQNNCVAVLLSYDSIRIRVCTFLPIATSKVQAKHDGQPLYEYAVVTAKRDSRQHVLHMTGLPNQPHNDLPPRLVTAKLQKGLPHDRAIHGYDDKADLWGAIYEHSTTEWRVQTVAGVDPILILAFVLSTDRFKQYVEVQHLRRTATLDAVSNVGTVSS